MTTFNEDVSTATILVSENKFEDAISHYKNALEKCEYQEQQIDITNAIGRLYLNLNKLEQAVDFFEKSLDVHTKLPEEKAKTLKENKAAILNNLGVIILKQDVKKAIKYHREALDIFAESNLNGSNDYSLHLGNTHYSLAEAYYLKKDFFMAKKHFKEAVKIYDTKKTTIKQRLFYREMRFII